MFPLAGKCEIPVDAVVGVNVLRAFLARGGAAHEHLADRTGATRRRERARQRTDARAVEALTVHEERRCTDES